MRATFFIICILFLIGQGKAQHKQALDICCMEYDSVMVQLFHFAIKNSSDSGYNFTYPNITQSRCLNIIRKTSLAKDTLVIDFTSQYGHTVHTSHPLNYLINDTYFLQGYIKPRKSLDLAVKMDAAIFSTLHYLKVKLPDSSLLISKVKLNE